MSKRLLRKQKQDIGKRVLAHASDDTPPGKPHPLFSLRYVDRAYCLSSCTKKEKAAFADTIHKLSKIPWAEIETAPKHGSGYERIARSSLRRPVPSHVTEDTTIKAFRFFGRAVMVGYRSGDVFFVIWFDRRFKLYPH